MILLGLWLGWQWRLEQVLLLCQGEVGGAAAIQGEEGEPTKGELTEGLPLPLQGPPQISALQVCIRAYPRLLQRRGLSVCLHRKGRDRWELMA